MDNWTDLLRPAPNLTDLKSKSVDAARLRKQKQIDPVRYEQQQELERLQTLSPADFAAFGQTPELQRQRYDLARQYRAGVYNANLEARNREWVDAHARGTPEGEAAAAALNVGSSALKLGTSLLGQLPVSILAEAGLANADINYENLGAIKSVQAKEQKLAEIDEALKNTSGIQAGVLRAARAKYLPENYAPEEQAVVDGGQVQALKTYEKRQNTLQAMDQFTESLEGRISNASTVNAVRNISQNYRDNKPQLIDGVEDIKNGNYAEGGMKLLKSVVDLGVTGFKELADSPAVVGDAIFQSLPHVALAKKSLLAAAGGAITAQHRDALNAWEEQYGDIPLGDTRTAMNAWVALAGIAETMGDTLIGHGGSAVKAAKNAVKPAQNAAKKLSDASKAFKNKLTGKPAPAKTDAKPDTPVESKPVETPTKVDTSGPAEQKPNTASESAKPKPAKTEQPSAKPVEPVRAGEGEPLTLKTGAVETAKALGKGTAYVANKTKPAVKSAAEEYVAEGAGAILGDQAVKQDFSQVDYAEAHAAAVLGAGSGGALGGAIAAVDATVDAVKAGDEKFAEHQKKQKLNQTAEDIKRNHVDYISKHSSDNDYVSTLGRNRMVVQNKLLALELVREEAEKAGNEEAVIKARQDTAEYQKVSQNIESALEKKLEKILKPQDDDVAELTKTPGSVSATPKTVDAELTQKAPEIGTKTQADAQQRKSVFVSDDTYAVAPKEVWHPVTAEDGKRYSLYQEIRKYDVQENGETRTYELSVQNDGSRILTAKAQKGGKPLFRSIKKGEPESKLVEGTPLERKSTESATENVASKVVEVKLPEFDSNIEEAAEPITQYAAQVINNPDQHSSSEIAHALKHYEQVYNMGQRELANAIADGEQLSDAELNYIGQTEAIRKRLTELNEQHTGRTVNPANGAQQSQDTLNRVVRQHGSHLDDLLDGENGELKADDIDQLVNSKVLTKVQKQALKALPELQKLFKQLHTAKKHFMSQGKSLEDVNNDLLEGDPEFNLKGVRQHTRSIVRAIQTNDARSAANTLTLVKRLIQRQKRLLAQKDNTPAFNEFVRSELVAYSALHKQLGQLAYDAMPAMDQYLRKAADTVGESKAIADEELRALSGRAPRNKSYSGPKNRRGFGRVKARQRTDEVRPLTLQARSKLLGRFFNNQYGLAYKANKTDKQVVQRLENDGILSLEQEQKVNAALDLLERHRKTPKDQREHSFKKADLKDARRLVGDTFEIINNLYAEQNSSLRERLENDKEHGPEVHAVLDESDRVTSQDELSDEAALADLTVPAHEIVPDMSAVDKADIDKSQPLTQGLVDAVLAAETGTNKGQVPKGQLKKLTAKLLNGITVPTRGIAEIYTLAQNLINNNELLNGTQPNPDADPGKAFTQLVDNTRLVLSSARVGSTVQEHFVTAGKPKQIGLHREQNFVSKLIHNTGQLYNRLTYSFSQKDRKALDNILGLVEDHGDVLVEQLKNTEEYSHNDLINDFIQGHESDGSAILNENLISTVSLISYQWIANNGAKTLYNTDRDINTLLFRDKKTQISKNESDAFRDVGTNLSTVVDQIGGQVMKALNIQLKSTSPDLYKEQLRTSFGLAAVDALIAQGFAEQHYVTEQRSGNKVYYKAHTKPPKGQHRRFIKIKNQSVEVDMGNGKKVKQTQMVPEMEAVREVVQQSDNLFTQVFGLDSNRYEIYTDKEEVTKLAPTTTNDGVPLADEQEDSVKKLVQTGWQFDQRAIRSFLSMTLLEKAKLYKSAEGNKYIENYQEVLHEDRWKQQEAINNEIIRDLQEIERMINTYGTQVMYFNYGVSSNLRMQMQGLVTPQSSSILRHLLKPTSWHAKINLTVTEQRDAFRMAMAQALDVDVDKQNQQATFDALQKTMDNPVIRIGADAMHRSLRDGSNTSEEDQKLIQAALAEINNGYWGYDGLVALAQYQNASRNNLDQITTRLMYESDGITNGISIGMMQLLAGNSFNDVANVLEATGIGVREAIPSYGDWYRNGLNQDNYQQLMSGTEAQLELMDMAGADNDWDTRNSLAYTGWGNKIIPHSTVKKSQRTLAQWFNEARMTETFYVTDPETGQRKIGSKGRNIAKPILMVSNYGASVEKVLDTLGDLAVNRLYKKLENIATKPEDEQLKWLKQLEDQLAVIIPEGLVRKKGKPDEYKLFDAEKAFKEGVLKAKVDNGLIRAIHDAVGQSYGRATGQSLKQTFGPLRDLGETMNFAVGQSHTLYVRILEKHLETKAREVGAESVDHLSRKQFDEVIEATKHASPLIATALSALHKDGEAALDGINLSDFERKALYEGQLDEKVLKENGQQHLVVTRNINQVREGTQSARRLSIQGKRPKDPRVRGLVLLIQSLDASTIVKLAQKYEFLNIHDAGGFNPLEAEAATKAFNQGHMDLHKSYSIAEAIQKMLHRVRDAYVKEFPEDQHLDGVPVEVGAARQDGSRKVLKKNGVVISMGSFIEGFDAVVSMVEGNHDIVYPLIKSSVQYNREGSVVMDPFGNGNTDQVTDPSTVQLFTTPLQAQWEAEYPMKGEYTEQYSGIVGLRELQHNLLHNMTFEDYPETGPELEQMRTQVASFLEAGKDPDDAFMQVRATFENFMDLTSPEMVLMNQLRGILQERVYAHVNGNAYPKTKQERERGRKLFSGISVLKYTEDGAISEEDYLDYADPDTLVDEDFEFIEYDMVTDSSAGRWLSPFKQQVKDQVDVLLMQYPEITVEQAIDMVMARNGTDSAMREAGIAVKMGYLYLLYSKRYVPKAPRKKTSSVIDPLGPNLEGNGPDEYSSDRQKARTREANQLLVRLVHSMEAHKDLRNYLKQPYAKGKQLLKKRISQADTVLGIDGMLELLTQEIDELKAKLAQPLPQVRWHHELAGLEILHRQLSQQNTKTQFQAIHDNYVTLKRGELIEGLKRRRFQTRQRDGFTKEDKHEAALLIANVMESDDKLVSFDEIYKKAAARVDSGKTLKALSWVIDDLKTANKGTVFGSSGFRLIPGEYAEQQDVTKDNIHSTYQQLAVFNVPGTEPTGEHATRLTNLVQIAEQVMSPIKLFMRHKQMETHGHSQGQNVYVSTNTGAQANGIEMSAQEVFVHEILHPLVEAAINGDSKAARELNRLFKVMAKLIKPEHFLKDPADVDNPIEMDAATRMWKHIFRNQSIGKVRNISSYAQIGHSDTATGHLHEFLILGTSNRQVVEAFLKVDSATIDKALKEADSGLTLIERLYRFLENLFLRFTGQYPQYMKGNGEQRLYALMEAMAGIHNSKASMLYRFMSNVAAIPVNSIQKTLDYTVKPLANALEKIYHHQESRALSNNRIVRLAQIAGQGATLGAATLLRGGSDQFLQAMHSTLERSGALRNQTVNDIVTDLAGNNKSVAKLHQLFMRGNKLIDQTRVDIETKTRKYLDALFTEMDNESAESVTRGLLQTDFVSLMDAYGIDQGLTFLKSPSAIRNELQNLYQKLARYNSADNTRYYNAMAKNLGHFMATGRSMLKEDVLLNSDQIVRMVGTDKEMLMELREGVVYANGMSAELLEKNRETIDRIAELTALLYTNSKDLQLATDVVEKYTDPDNRSNDVMPFMQLMTMHRDAQQTALKNLFHGNPALMRKGYVKETYNPHVHVKVGPASLAAELEPLGYVRGDVVKHDSNYPDSASFGSNYYWVNQNGGHARHVSGLFGTTGMQHSGTDTYSVNRSQNPEELTYDLSSDLPLGAQDVNFINHNKRVGNTKLFTHGGTRNTENDPVLVRITNENYKTVGFRYMATDHTRRNLMERKDDFRHVMGATYGSMHGKRESVKHNRLVADHLLSVAQREYAKNPNAFIKIGLTDDVSKENKERWMMLPVDLRKYIEGQNQRSNSQLHGKGTSYMYVKRNQANLLFGFRMPSVANLKKGDYPSMLDAHKSMQYMWDRMVPFLNNRFSRWTERTWQEVVAASKDGIVIKNFVTTAFNELSNKILLWVLGVAGKDIARHHNVAIQGAMQYRRDSEALFNAKLLARAQDLSASERRDVDNTIRKLENDLSQNPVREMIMAGVFQNIIEDVEDVRDEFSQREKLRKKLEEWGNLNTATRAGKSMADFVFMSHNTKLYSMARDMAQLSDFAARYTLHQHNLAKGMDRHKSVEMANEIFIQYDMPTNRGIQYMNSIGMWMFTKYLFRTQKVIKYLFEEHTARSLTVMLLQSMWMDVPDVTDSFIFGGALFRNFNLNPLGTAEGLLEAAPLKLAAWAA